MWVQKPYTEMRLSWLNLMSFWKQLDSISFVRSFDNIKQSKVSGSSPSKFYLLTIYTDAFETHLNIGRDSENEDLYWVYPYEEPKIKIPLGYINLEWFRLPNDLSCDHLVSPWIYDSIPKWFSIWIQSLALAGLFIVFKLSAGALFLAAFEAKDCFQTSIIT